MIDSWINFPSCCNTISEIFYLMGCRLENHRRLARWRKWRACDVGEAKEELENELRRRWSDWCVGEWGHSITLPLLHLRQPASRPWTLISLYRQIITIWSLSTAQTKENYWILPSRFEIKIWREWRKQKWRAILDDLPIRHCTKRLNFNKKFIPVYILLPGEGNALFHCNKILLSALQSKFLPTLANSYVNEATIFIKYSYNNNMVGIPTISLVACLLRACAHRFYIQIVHFTFFYFDRGRRVRSSIVMTDLLLYRCESYYNWRANCALYRWTQSLHFVHSFTFSLPTYRKLTKLLLWGTYVPHKRVILLEIWKKRYISLLYH